MWWKTKEVPCVRWMNGKCQRRKTLHCILPLAATLFVSELLASPASSMVSLRGPQIGMVGLP